MTGVREVNCITTYYYCTTAKYIICYPGDIPYAYATPYASLRSMSGTGPVTVLSRLPDGSTIGDLDSIVSRLMADLGWSLTGVTRIKIAYHRLYRMYYLLPLVVVPILVLVSAVSDQCH